MGRRFSVGPADEAGQAPLFSIVSNSNPGLFAAGPAIAADGALSYTPAPDASGTALLVAVLDRRRGDGRGWRGRLAAGDLRGDGRRR